MFCMSACEPTLNNNLPDITQALNFFNEWLKPSVINDI